MGYNLGPVIRGDSNNRTEFDELVKDFIRDLQISKLEQQKKYETQVKTLENQLLQLRKHIQEKLGDDNLNDIQLKINGEDTQSQNKNDTKKRVMTNNLINPNQRKIKKKGVNFAEDSD